MKEINLPSGNYIFLSIFKDASNFVIIKDNHFGNRIYYDNNKDDESFKFDCKYIEIPNNQYQIISTTNDITEEQCKDLIEYRVDKEMFKDYEYYNKDKYSIGILSQWNIKTAKESLKSLMQANNLNIENNYLILKKI